MRLLHVFYASLISFCWGINAPVLKMALVDLSPLVFGTYRTVLLSFLVLFFPRPHLPQGVILVFSMLHGIKITLLNYALALGIPSGISTVLLQSQSLFTVLLAALFFKEKVSLTSITGLLMAFAGVCIISLNLHTTGNTLSMVLVLLSALVAAFSFLVMRNHKNVHYLSFIGYFNLWSVVPFILTTVWVESPDVLLTSLSTLDLRLLSLIVASALTVVGAYTFMVYLFSLYPTSQVAPYFLLVPLFGLTGGYLCLGEWCSLHAWVGSAIVILGLALNQYGSPRQRLS